MRLSTLTLLVLAMASPAVADDVVVTGALTADKGTVTITAGKQAYTVTGEQVSTLLRIAVSNPTKTPRTVTVEGESSSKIDAGGVLKRTLDVYQLTSPRSITARGVASSHDGKTTLALESQDGKQTDTNLTLSGVPAALLKQLDQRRVTVAGWRFGDELQLTSAQATVTKDGWLSADKDPKTGRFPRVGEVTVGQPVRVLALAAYEKATQTMKPIAQLKAGDLVFARVGAGRSRGQGEGYPFVGWMPTFKLSFGEKVEPLPEQQSVGAMPPQGDGADGAAKKLEQAQKKKGAE